MGWFWAEANTIPYAICSVSPPHPIASGTNSRTPPPSCPMHTPHAVPSSSGSCPYTPPDNTSISTPDGPSSKSSTTLTSRSPLLDRLNPLNLMPSLPQSPISSSQRTALPTERETSTIPRGLPGTEGESNWVYPSPQQMYNALARKGKAEPEELMENVVAVHNFLNEGAWNEIRAWESTFASGILEGWRKASSGATLEGMELRDMGAREPRLLKFEGNSKKLSPAAQWQLFMARWLPERYSNQPPFDRHDWVVLRTVSYEKQGTEPLQSRDADPSSFEKKNSVSRGDVQVKDVQTREIRYVIDYYAAPDDEEGNPVFHLVVRPALDSPQAAMERVVKAVGETWYKGTGGGVREQLRKEKGEGMGWWSKK